MVNETIGADNNSSVKRPIVAVIDVPSQAYDVSNFATLGLLSDLLTITDPDAPSDVDLAMVKIVLQKVISDARQNPSLKNRLGAENRYSSSLVRERIRAT